MRDYLRPVIVLALISLATALGLAGVYQQTKDPIAANKKLALRESLGRVLSDFDNQPEETGLGLKLPGGFPITFYRGEKAGRVNGLAFLVSTPEGYAGNIEVLAGISPDGVLKGVEILSQNETPGLGNRILRPEFLSQFREKNLARPDPDRWKVKKDGGDFDSLTGATISPRAIVKALRQGLVCFQENRETILKGAPK